MSILGLIEFRAITPGMVATDAMVKRAPVTVLETAPLDPGGYLTIITGDLACVEEAVDAGCLSGGAALVRGVVLANLHDAVIPALKGEVSRPEPGAMGIVETVDCVAAVHAADAACKAAPVALYTLHLARHIGGKGYMVFVGELPDVAAAEDAARETAGGALVESTVIPQPDEAFFAQVLQPTVLRKLGER